MSAISESLAEMIRGEIQSPGSLGDVLGRIREERPDLSTLLQFLSLKDHHHRHAFYVKSGHVFLRRLGWRLMRPLFLLALAAAGVALLQRTLDPTEALSLFLGGAASLYVLLQVFLHRWAWKDMKKLASIEAEYRKNLTRLLEGEE